MRKVYSVQIKRVEYGTVLVQAENEEQAGSLALDRVINLILPPYHAIDTVESVTEVIDD